MNLCLSCKHVEAAHHSTLPESPTRCYDCIDKHVTRFFTCPKTDTALNEAMDNLIEARKVACKKFVDNLKYLERLADEQ